VLKPAPPGSDSLRRDLTHVMTLGRASNDAADRVAYARDLWPRQQIRTRAGEAAIAPPACVAWPESTEEVAAVVRFAHERSLPVVPFGAGSGVCGGILPSPDAIVLDMKRMRRLVHVDAGHLRARAQAGIIGQHLEDDLDARGFTLGHFPSSIYCSTLGGWIAGRSAGQCSGRYGKIEDMVLGLDFVDGTGRIHRAERGGENAALLPLVIGSEGILGVVTEADLRVAPAPRERVFAGFVFPSVSSGLEAIRRIYQSGLRPAVARLYDPFDSFMKRRGGLKPKQKKSAPPGAKRRSVGLGMRSLVAALEHARQLNRVVEWTPDRVLGGATLVLVWECDRALGEAERDEAARIARDLEAEDLGEEPGRHWLAHRHSVSYRQSPIFRAGAFSDTMEVSARWSRLEALYDGVRKALGRHVFVMAHFSHAYPDGASIYFTFAGAAKNDEEAAKIYDRAWADALAAAIEAGGSLSHHHGVGRSKAPFMRAEQGEAISLVASLKRTLDPNCIFNRGTLVPEEALHG
jgi:alkyldihydroxyacetonephosphate synthase